MDLNLDWVGVVAERKIQEAQEAGEFDDLPGKGEPINLDEDAHIPPGQRAVMKLLRNARALPPWLQMEKDIERERSQALPTRERALRALRFARNDASRERIAECLRADQRERMDLVNSLILKYNYTAPGRGHRAFIPFRIAQEMAALEEGIAAAFKSSRAAL